MILIVDNYDSFVHNLARYIRLAGAETEIIRNDKITAEGALALSPEAIVISPGPCTPDEAGISLELIRKARGKIPLLGVCLGHQSIAQAYGGLVVPAKQPHHGKSSRIKHNSVGLFETIPDQFEVGRYHSLAVANIETHGLVIDAVSEDGEIMAMHDPQSPVYGVQFHPESILTRYGDILIRNFIKISREHT